MGLPKQKHALPQQEVSSPSKEVCKHMPSQPSKAVVENAPLIHPSHFKLPGCFRPEDSEFLSTGTAVSNTVLKYFIHFSFSVRFYHSQNSVHRDIHSLAQQKGLQSGPSRVKNELTNVGQDMRGWFFLFLLTQRTQASV